MSQLHLFNSKTKSKEPFSSVDSKSVSVYTCGPTLYKPSHIGNLRCYIFADTLRRALEHLKFNTKYVINLTDVGHLVSDSDEGEDKIEKAAKDKNRSVEEIITSAKNAFFQDLDRLNIPRNKYVFPRATEYIKEQINLIRKLEDKGYTYQISDGVYFDISKFNEYGVLMNFKNMQQIEGARVKKNEEKRNSADFALWKLSPKGKKTLQEWPSPWGVGFPGWHIECSAMAMKLLKETIDIHTGGVDHMMIHHPNEIAQSECATGKEFARFWLHVEHAVIDGKKISKSLGNVITIQDLINLNYSPLTLRYLFLTTKYSTQLNFRYDALNAAEIALSKLHKFVNQAGLTVFTKPHEETMNKIIACILDDLDTPGALSYIWLLLKDKSVSNKQKAKTIKWADRFFGLNIGNDKSPTPPKEVLNLVKERDTARKSNNWDKSDSLRENIKEKGWTVEDTQEGSVVVPYRNSLN